MEFTFIDRASALLGVPLLSGTNFFLTIAAIGAVELFTDVSLPGMEFLARPEIVLLAAGIYLVETFGGTVVNSLTPSVPVDTAKETLKSFLVVPATAVLLGMMGSESSAFTERETVAAGFAAGMEIGPLSFVYFVVGGVLSAFTQSLKIFVRSVIDLLPEPLTNLGVELLEGGASVAGVLLIFFAPLIMLVISILFIIFFLLAGPRILRTARINYKAVFAAFKYYIKKQGAVFDPQKTDRALLNLAQKELAGQPETMARFISQRVPGMGVNFTGYVVLAQGKLLLAARGLARKKCVHLELGSITSAALYPGLLCDHLYITVPGEKKVCLKFLKTWKKDAELLYKKLPQAEPATGAPVADTP